MSMTVTERDKKLLGFLAAFIVLLLFFVFVFKPLAEKNKELEKEVGKMQELQSEYGDKASGAQDMLTKEKDTQQMLGNVLARFYPMQQSQDAERMITTLMLNHGLEIQSLSVTMPEIASKMKWYQYSANAKELEGQPAQETETGLSLYAARITCVAEGDEQSLWDLVDEISVSYPAISIVSTEWYTSEKPVAAAAMQETDEKKAGADGGEKDAEADGGEELSMPKTITTSRLTISFEIFMCNQ